MEGNQMKIREAIEEILLICYKAGARYGYDVACGLIKSKAKKALSEPPRNCDVGTAEEQSDMFMEFCKKHAKGCGLGYGSKGIGHPKVTCPAFKGMECAIVWSQMPYEAQEGGAM